jgi:hypothetical protein
MAGVHTEIRTEQLPHISQEPYRYTNTLGWESFTETKADTYLRINLLGDVINFIDTQPFPR